MKEINTVKDMMDIQVYLNPQVSLEDGNFVLHINGTKWVRENQSSPAPLESQGSMLLELLKLYEENRDSGTDYSKIISTLQSKFILTRKKEGDLQE